MLAKVYSAALVGLDAVTVVVEVDIASQGLPSCTIVGLPDKAIEESRERVRSALKNSGADFPARRITINLAPADLPKEGPAYDLPIALGILVASGQIKAIDTTPFVYGELSLEGTVRATNGILPLALLAKKLKGRDIFIPAENTMEAALVPEITAYPVDSLQVLFDHLTGVKRIKPAVPVLRNNDSASETDIDFGDIQGQEQAKRAAEIAVAGGHNMFMHGPPGAGKTLLARAIRGILPRLTDQELIEVTQIYSVVGLLTPGTTVSERPYRSPHHTTSKIGLIGGGSYPKPGEISLAHRGVLFLDEILEFPRSVLEALRQPVEDGVVTISRASGAVRFPAKFMLVAAANPCPCGYFGSNTHRCTCTMTQINRYQKRMSGPLMDRIDIHVSLPALEVKDLILSTTGQKTSKEINSEVEKARSAQLNRANIIGVTTNAELSSRQVKKYCHMTQEAESILQKAITVYQLSARTYYRIIKVSQTIADLECAGIIEMQHIAEALQYRPRFSQ